jgi:hemolysin III
MAAPAPALYDAKRAIFYTKPVLRGWLHLLWFVASVVCGTLLVSAARGVPHRIAEGVYAVSVTGLFGTSALYHRGRWSQAWSRRLQRLDHVMIFFLIAGTATPAFLLAVGGTAGLVCLGVLWAITVTAAAIHLGWMGAPEKLVGTVFVGLGWTAGLSLPVVWMHEGAVPGALLIVGGLLYTVGAVAYHYRRPDPVPAVFGYHEVFHACVCAAAACQFIAIAMFAR